MNKFEKTVVNITDKILEHRAEKVRKVMITNKKGKIKPIGFIILITHPISFFKALADEISNNELSYEDMRELQKKR